MTLAGCNLLIFNIGPVACCVDSNSVQIVIEPPPHITAIPGSNSYRPGLFTHVKRAVAVYDVRTKFNLPTEQRGKILLADINQRLFGFWVDNIQGIISSDQGNWQPLPVECPRELFEGILLYKSQLIFKTSFEALANAQVNAQTHTFIKKLMPAPQKSKTETRKKPPTQIQTHFHNDEEDEHNKVIPVSANAKPETKAFISKKIAASQQTTASKPHIPVTKASTLDLTKPQRRIQRLKQEDTGIAPSVTRSDYTPPPKAQKLDTPTLNKPLTTHSTRINSIPTSVRQTVNNQHNNKELRASKKEKKNNTNADLIHEDNTGQSSANSGIILLLLALICTPLLGYYFFFQSPTLSSNSKIKSTLQKDRTEYLIATDTKPLTPVISKPFINTETAKELSNKTLIKEKPQAINKPDQIADREETGYNTTITQATDTIIITIDDPDAKLNTASPGAKKESHVLVDDNTENHSEIKTALIEDNIETPDAMTTALIKETKTSQQVTHIVVKGDTLWHIAKRYIQDPFKYKQLARLSKIKNPDRIYPGNRIIIILIKEKAGSKAD